MSQNTPTSTEPSSLLPTYLATRDEPCPSCGYNLRALKTDRCPECNQQLVLRVGLAEPRMGAFITGLVGLAMGFGFCVIFASSYAICRLSEPYSIGIDWRHLWPTATGSFVLGTALLCWLCWRRTMNRMSPPLYWVLAAMCFLASGIAAYTCYVVYWPTNELIFSDPAPLN